MVYPGTGSMHDSGAEGRDRHRAGQYRVCRTNGFRAGRGLCTNRTHIRNKFHFAIGASLSACR